MKASQAIQDLARALELGPTMEQWTSYSPGDQNYKHAVRASPGCICLMPEWKMHEELRLQQIANHALILAANPAAIRALLEHVAALEKDARRYEFLRDRLAAADFAYGDPPRPVLVFDWPANVGVGGNCDKNIDAAIRDGEGAV